MTSDLRERWRVRIDSGTLESTTVPANTVMSMPTCDSVTARSAAISGRSPVGRNSLVTEVKMSAASTISPTHGKGRTPVPASVTRMVR